MTLPTNASRWPQPMDPTDHVDYEADFRGRNPLLEEGEKIASFTVALLPEAAILGLTISQQAGYAPTLTHDGSRVRLYFEVNEAQRSDPAFDLAGVDFGVVFTINTDALPPRRRQRTFILKVQQQ